MKSITLSIITLLVFLFTQQPANAQNNNPSCSEQKKFQLLDFWVGQWDVYVEARKVGSNTIEKVVDGCAIIENWNSTKGNMGKSLFYFYPKEKRWKQVWVTENPFSNGGVKEKAHVKTFENGGTIFEGTVISAQGAEYLDRTTLTPLENGNVEQVIEISTDSGENWRQMFKGVYKPAER